MSENMSVLQFEKYIVKYVTYVTNEAYDARKKVKLSFDFDADVHTSEDSKKMEIELTAYVFKDAVKNNYPFEMSVGLKGYFEIISGNDSIESFEENAIAILFPYLRAIVSTYTANVNVAPVILPPMNINAFLQNKKKRENKQV